MLGTAACEGRLDGQSVQGGGWILLGTALGFLLGLGMGWGAMTLFSASSTAFLQIWGYSIAIGTILLFAIGALLGSD